MGGRLRRKETYVYRGLIHVVSQKATQYCKASIVQLKINKFFLKDSGDGDFPGGAVVRTLPSQCRFDPFSED